MEVIDKNLDYFFEYMPHEKDASPTEFEVNHPIFPKIKTILEYLNRNYAKLDDTNVKYHYYQRKKEIKLLGLEINLDNPDSELLGIIRIYHRSSEDMFYYTFQTTIDMPREKDTQKQLIQVVKSLGLKKLPHSSSFEPIFYCRFKNLEKNSFESFYEKLTQMARKICLRHPF